MAGWLQSAQSGPSLAPEPLPAAGPPPRPVAPGSRRPAPLRPASIWWRWRAGPATTPWGWCETAGLVPGRRSSRCRGGLLSLDVDEQIGQLSLAGGLDAGPSGTPCAHPLGTLQRSGRGHPPAAHPMGPPQRSRSVGRGRRAAVHQTGCRSDRLPQPTGRRPGSPRKATGSWSPAPGWLPSPTRPGWCWRSAGRTGPAIPAGRAARRAAAGGPAPRRPPAQRRPAGRTAARALDALRALLGAAHRRERGSRPATAPGRPVADGHRRGLVGPAGGRHLARHLSGSRNGPGSRSTRTS